MATAMVTERGIHMTGSKSEKDMRQAEKAKPKREDMPSHGYPGQETAALAALSGSLRFGALPAISSEKSMEAAGTLGNQNVLDLLATGANLLRTIDDLRTDTDTQGLAEALSGPPDSPVCDMGLLL